MVCPQRLLLVLLLSAAAADLVARQEVLDSRQLWVAAQPLEALPLQLLLLAELPQVAVVSANLLLLVAVVHLDHSQRLLQQEALEAPEEAEPLVEHQEQVASVLWRILLDLEVWERLRLQHRLEHLHRLVLLDAKSISSTMLVVQVMNVI